MKSDILNLIKESFENWYNTVHPENPTAIVINYSDTQKLPIKAYHTACLELCTVSVNEDGPDVNHLVMLEENYNHGIVSEEEAKEGVVKKLLERLYGYDR